MSTTAPNYYVDTDTVYKRGHGPVRFWTVYETGAGDTPDVAIEDFRHPKHASNYCDDLNRQARSRKEARTA